MERKSKTEILYKIHQLLKPRAFGVIKPHQDWLDGFVDALEWTLSINHHSKEYENENKTQPKK